MNGETMQTSLRLHPYIIKQRYSDIIQPIFRNLVSKFFDVRSCEALACVCFDRASMSEQSSRMMVSSWKSAERMLQTCSYFEYIDRLCVKDVLDFIEIMLMDIQEHVTNWRKNCVVIRALQMLFTFEMHCFFANVPGLIHVPHIAMMMMLENTLVTWSHCLRFSRFG